MNIILFQIDDAAFAALSSCTPRERHFMMKAIKKDIRYKFL